MKEKILGSSHHGKPKNVKFSDKSQQKLIENLSRMRKERDAEFYEREAIKEKSGKAKKRAVHPEVKRALFSLIILLGRKVKNGAKIWNISLLGLFLLGNNP